MKQLLTYFCLLVLLNIICSNSMYAQLPFAPFSAYSGNPVVSKTPGTWDQSAVWWADVIVVNDTFYLTYDGTSNFPTTPGSIGLAVSSDGFTFSKSLSNPILAGDGSGFDAYSADGGVIFFDNSVWYIYYSGKSVTISQPGNVIGRATSSISPHGLWTRSNDTLITIGGTGEWDSEFISPSSIVRNGTNLSMYYIAGSNWPGPAQIGLATSIDNGNTWQKYDDPTTTSHPYAESDPVLKPDKPYDNYSLWGCTVLRTSTGWQMFYAGDKVTVVAICYATSADGINWVKDDLNNPIFSPSQDPLTPYNMFEQPSVIIYDNKYLMYYDYGVGPNSAGIGMAMADYVIPVELISFTATSNGNEVILSWSTATELNNHGFEIQRKFCSNSFVTIGSITGHGTTTSPNQYSFVDKILDAGKYFYRLKQLDFNGTFEYSNVIEIDVRSIDEFTLKQNYPNPFNPTTKISWQSPVSSWQTLKVFDILGNEIATLVDEYKPAGIYEIEFSNAETHHGVSLPSGVSSRGGYASGVYFYRIQAGNFIETKKMIFLR